MSAHLDRLARRVTRDTFFVAAPLACFAESHRMDDTALAGHLGCDTGTLTHLRLCRNPDPDPPHFWRDIERIADRFSIDPDTLAASVKLGQALLHARRPTEEGVGEAAGYLMAARDGDPVAEVRLDGGGGP